MGCCKAPPLRPKMDTPIDECLEKIKKSSKPDADADCELEMCIGKKQGYIADDGTINKSVLETVVAQLFEERPELVERIKKYCINSDIKEYGFADFCELKKLGHCVYVQYAMSCPEFDNRGRCSEIKSLAEKCAAE